MWLHNSICGGERPTRLAMDPVLNQIEFNLDDSAIWNLTKKCTHLVHNHSTDGAIGHNIILASYNFTKNKFTRSSIYLFSDFSFFAGW